MKILVFLLVSMAFLIILQSNYISLGKLYVISNGCLNNQKLSSKEINELVKNLKFKFNGFSTQSFIKLCLHIVKKLFIIKRFVNKN